ncbi:MAG: prolyl oligopeptidase family serine peptidase [Pseudomonadales bacterium]
MNTVMQPDAAPKDPSSPRPPSSLTAKMVANGATQLLELRAESTAIYWLESLPAEGGRVTLKCCVPSQNTTVEELTPAPCSVRTRVHEYGGGAYLPTAAGVFLVDDAIGEIRLLQPDGTLRTLTACAGAARFADLAWDAVRRRLIAVCERPGSGEPENLIVDFPIDGKPVRADELHILHAGHDFYAAPRLNADASRLAFVVWDHPLMPWDGGNLIVAERATDGSLHNELVIAGGIDEAVQQPLWCSDGALMFFSDATGFWNVWRHDASGVRCVLEDGADYAEAPWMLGGARLAMPSPDWCAALRRSEGQTELVLIDVHRGFATPLSLSCAEIDALAVVPGAIACLARPADAPPQLLLYHLSSGDTRVLARAGAPLLSPELVSRPEACTFRARDGYSIAGQFYPPSNAPDELPPLLVLAHGGPTGRTDTAFNARIQFFTRRGWAVLDVDYRGSSGLGRAYRNALRGHWGERDADDCEDAAHALVQMRRVDPHRVAIRGSSAGGLTVLAALTRGRLFRAGISAYGIGDLDALARETHKFESRYVDALIGGPEQRHSRSPIHRVDQIRASILLLQGSEDRIVPAAQSRAMVSALRAARIPVAYVEFPGEGHGFRRAEHIEQALATEYAFLCQALDISSAEPLVTLEIDLP